MNKGKSIFLFLILVLPIIIYLFLQGFGKNHFAIPIYFQSGIEKPLDGCSVTASQETYQLNTDLISELIQAPYNNNQISVFELGNENSEKLRNNLYTFLDKYKDHEKIKLISIRSISDTLNKSNRYSAWKRYNLPDSNLLKLGRCILQLEINKSLKADSGLILVDQNQRIRGYYDPMVLKEIDRLNTELYILLNEQTQINEL